jgi:hypothetical protein
VSPVKGQEVSTLLRERPHGASHPFWRTQVPSGQDSLFFIHLFNVHTLFGSFLPPAPSPVQDSLGAWNLLGL